MNYTLTLKDGKTMQVEAGSSVFDAAKQISEGLARAALVAKLDGQLVDMSKIINKDASLELFTFDSIEGKKTFWHTASHILAHAVKRLFPDVQLAIGPAIDTGFYYDFDTNITFDSDVLEKIEAEMAKIVKENLRLERFTLPKAEALALVKDEPYKVELINDLPEDSEISFYKQGDFTDLCAGTHLFATGGVKAIKLLSATGAYWRGDSKNKMLGRIYGTAFQKNSELTEYLTQLEEAKKRDHNKLGRELEYFTTVDYIGQGLPIIMPKGAKVIQILQRFVEDMEEANGFMITRTPMLAKSDLYKVSGHWDHYRDGMFILGDEEKDEDVLALRPMTCPFQFQVYLARHRSYRELPMRFYETATLFRNESSGEMHGLIRVRQFTISEGHLVCTKAQVADEFKACVANASNMLKAIGLHDDVSYRLSKWDENNREKYIGDAADWEKLQDEMREILVDMQLPFTEASGEAAFYGPKLDIQIKNVHGKEDTLITVQIDFSLAERFGMEYIESDGTKKFPLIIHRTSIGCYERTLALLIEKYAGAMPMWLAPEQVRILPITDRTLDASNTMKKELQNRGIRVTVDERSEKLGYKIREAQMEKLPYMIVLGDKEVEDGVVAVRSRKEGDLGTMTLESFLAKINEEIQTKAL